MGKWKWFSEEEVKGLKDDLVYKLDRAREFYGRPIVITSGYRDPEKNKSVGGVSNSLHTQGLAADLRGPLDPGARERMAWALGRAGFEQVGSYQKRKHFHVELDRRNPPAFWIDD